MTALEWSRLATLLKRAGEEPSGLDMQSKNLLRTLGQISDRMSVYAADEAAVQLDKYNQGVVG